MTVGRVTAVSWAGQEALATSLAEFADHASGFPGIGALPDRPVRLILAPTRQRYDSLTRGRLPFWSEGAAFPDAGTIVWPNGADLDPIVLHAAVKGQSLLD